MNEQMDGEVENESSVFMMRNLRHWNTSLSFDSQGDPGFCGGGLGVDKNKKTWQCGKDYNF